MIADPLSKGPHAGVEVGVGAVATSPREFAPELPGAICLGAGLSREEWLAKRVIGGSDIATLFDANPYGSRFALYHTLRGEGVPVEENQAMRWGSALEQPIADEFSAITGIKTMQPPNITIYRAKDYPFATASPDRLAMDDDNVFGWVEIKNVGYYKLAEWQDDSIPKHYWMQAQWELAVSGLPVCHVAALIGGNNLEHRTIWRDEKWIAQAFNRAEQFMNNYVLKGVVPDIDGSQATKNVLDATYSERLIEPIELGLDLAEIMTNYLEFSEEEKFAKSAKQTAHNRIVALLAGHEVGTVNGIPWVSLKKQRRYGKETTVLRPLKGATE